MDTFLVLQMFTNYADVLGSMKKRYQKCMDTGRGVLVTNLSNLWYNYDFPKKRDLGYVK